MSRTKLNNYLRAYRKRSGLSQDEVAYLLGSQTGSKVSRYEHGRRPSLDTALAYEVIFRLFDIPTRELFAGRYQKVESSIRRRAARLQERIHARPKLSSRKVETLAAIRKIASSAPLP